MAPVLHPLELTFPEYICLRMLSHTPGMSNAQLARDANVSRQAMNMVLRGLQDRGLVVRPARAVAGGARPDELNPAGTVLLQRTDSVVCAAAAPIVVALGAD